MSNESLDLFVPGRLCIPGEHTDWAGTYRRFNSDIDKGLSLVVGTNQGIYARVAEHEDRLIYRTTDSEGNRRELDIPMNTELLLNEARQGGYFSYIAGVAYQIMTHYRVQGLEIDNYRTDLPIGKGLSSSAAVCVLVTRAFNTVYDLKMTTRGEMEYAYKGEITTPSRCGRLDQACAFGNRPVMVEFDGDNLEVRELKVKNALYFVIVNLKASKDTIRILADLNKCFPFPTDDIESKAHQFLAKRSMEITRYAGEAMEEGKLKDLGDRMIQAQSEFDSSCAPASPEELASPVLHRLLSDNRLQSLGYGMKGVGSQGDGTAQILARDLDARREILRIINDELGMEGIPLDIPPAKSVRKAVIPAAGFGTRLFPATKAIKKEFMPIIDEKGVCKPLIFLLVEEAVESGIDQVGLIIRPEDKPLFEDFFHTRLSEEHYRKLSTEARRQLDHVLTLGKKVEFIEQTSAEGFGHAVYQARSWVGSEPFVLMLGDHLYRSGENRRCTCQIIDAFKEHGRNAIGICIEPIEHSNRFGCVTGSWTDDTILDISDIIEKPDQEMAVESLSMEDLKHDEVMTLFGIYVLNPSVFDLIGEAIEKDDRINGEIQLTPSLDRLRKLEGFIGCLVDGRRFDVGQADGYSYTLNHYPDR